MGGKGSGRRILSYKETIEEIYDSLSEIQDLLESAHKKMDILGQRLLYYSKTVSKRR
ncbi:MAG TPA: hypothetical protein VMW36_06020 [Patescibacteria group bacterium]|nr:hypothetical protein [Patescibacteria group bacterium]